MTVKRSSIIFGFFLLICSATVFAVPQIAVLDAILAPGIDPTVAGPVADKIVEELLRSEKYTVLDRANVEHILQEKEFQLSSGIVRNEEVRQAGEYLGADLVVVANVSRVGSTYVISARMIDVMTGEIVGQASAEKEGKIDVLLEIARVVGKQISGQEIVVAESTKETEEEKEAEAVKQPAAGSNQMAMASLQELIRRRTHMKRGGDQQMQPFVAQINDQERMLLNTSNSKDDAVTGFLLNLLIPWACVGSWIQRDLQGVFISYSLTVSAAVCVGAGVRGSPELLRLGYLIGGLDILYYCIRPFRFVKQWNRNLATILGVPYLSLLDGRENSIGLVQTGVGTELQFGVNIVSIEY